MPGTVFVALLCTRSTASMSRINLGFHITLPHSSIGRTLEVKSCTKCVCPYTSPPSHFGGILFLTFLLRDIILRHLTIAGT